MKRIEDVAKRRQPITVTLSAQAIIKLVTIAKFKEMASSHILEEMIHESFENYVKLWGGTEPQKSNIYTSK